MPFFFKIVLASAQAWAQSGNCDEGRCGIGLEFGPIWFSKSDVRVPGDTGTKFDMTDLTGSGPDVFARLGGYWNVNGRHGLRLLLAPIEVSGTGELQQDTDFAGETFPAGTTKGIYKFNLYKLTYRYTFRDRGAWRWRIGVPGPRSARRHFEHSLA